MPRVVPVWCWLPGRIESTLAGRFEWQEPRGPGIFQYDSEYLRQHRNLPLDPINLPVTPRPAKSVREEGLFGIFRDSGPDSWGEHQLRRQRGVDRLDPLDRLVLGTSAGAGCIALGELSTDRQKQPWTMDILQQAACRWARGETQSGDPGFDEFLLVASPPTTLGGGKPKLEIEAEGHLWIVKFPDKGDPHDFACIEAAALSLAAECGIQTPEHRVISLGEGDRSLQGLMIQRFDRRPVAGGFERLGFASAFTVMGLSTGSEDAEHYAYFRFAHEAARWCGRAGDRDASRMPAREIWRRVVFNALINNVDDHARNHALLRDGPQWRLSPIFDVIPVAHTTAQRSLWMPYFRGVSDGNRISMERLLATARLYRWEQAEAETELRRMADIVSRRWNALMVQHGTSEATRMARASAFGFAQAIGDQ